MRSTEEETNVLLLLANKIMEGLNQDIIIEDISYLFDDDFYVTILSNILRNISPEIGATKEEKAANLNNLVYNLSKIVDMDLSDISGDGIIFEEDTKSVKKLLELILEIIFTMNDGNGSEPNDGVINNEKIFSDSNINNEENTSEVNFNENNSNKNRRNNFENQILTSHSNSNFNLNDSPDSHLIENDEEKMKSSGRSHKISNSQSGSYNNQNIVNNTLKNSKNNGFNFIPSENNIKNTNIINSGKFDKQNSLDEGSVSNSQNIHNMKQYYEIADNQLTNENLQEKNYNDIVQYENEYEENTSNLEGKNHFNIHDNQQADDYTQEEANIQRYGERLNYSCMDYDYSKLDKSENLSLNYLYHILIQNNITDEEIQNLNNINQLNFLKSFSEKAILSRKFSYSENDCSRYLVEKNDINLLIGICKQENSDQINDQQNHQQSIDDFTSMLAGGKMKNIQMNDLDNKNINEFQGDESKSINISRISEVSRSKENSDQFSNQKYKNKHNSTSSKSNNMNFKSDDSMNAKMNSHSNLFKNSEANNLNNFSSKYNSQQDSYQPSKISYNTESKIDKNQIISKNQIKELQSLGSLDNEDNENFIDDEENYNEQQYNQQSHTDSMDINLMNMNMEESNKIGEEKTTNRKCQNQNILIKHNQKVTSAQKTSQRSNNTLNNRNSSRPLTAGTNLQNKNKIKQLKSNTNQNKNNHTNSSKSKTNNASNISNSINKSNLKNNRINSTKQINRPNYRNNANASKSDMSMSSIHSYGNNSNLQQKNKINSKTSHSQISNMNNYNSNYIQEEHDNINEENDEYGNAQEEYSQNDKNYNINEVEQDQQEQNEDDYDENENIDENEAEEYARDENLKQDILREFNRVYGNKMDKMLMRSQLQNSTNILDIILNNVKLAKNKMMKLARNDQDVDELATKELFLKYNKELNYVVNQVREEEKKRDKFITKVVRNMSNNTNVMRKLQNIEAKKIEDEINRRKKSRDIKNRHNKLRICEEIYNKALEMEKQKHIEERQTEAEIRKAENLEKRRKLIQIEAYYQDKLSILKETLRREKYEKELEFRANIQYLSKLQRERRGELKKQIDEMFTRMDEEDNKNEFKNCRPDLLEKILNIYYNN